LAIGLRLCVDRVDGLHLIIHLSGPLSIISELLPNSLSCQWKRIFCCSVALKLKEATVFEGIG